jgi:hypothetical protein
MLQEANGADKDIAQCCIHHSLIALRNAEADLMAANGTNDDPVPDMAEFESMFAMYQAQIAIDNQQADLPAHQRDGYAERMAEMADDRRAA